jgi:hypothetical protein
MPDDRYGRLLGLPPQPRPLNHYQLLGLGELEGDAVTIRRRADAVLAKLALHVGGPDNADALALMAEIGEAVQVLSDAARRAEYDHPIRQRKWAEFAVLEGQLASPGQPLLISARRQWIEAGLALGLPWQDVYRHVDEVAARLDQAAGGRGGPARRPTANVSPDEAGRIFRCLVLGVEISSGKGPRVYSQLTEAGDRLGFPRPAQTEAIQWAQGLRAADWRVPLPQDAVAIDRERAFEFVARGALLGRLLTAADETRLQEIAVRAGLTPEAARRVVERELGRVGGVRRRDLETEANAMAAIGTPLGDGPPTEEQAAFAQTQVQAVARRRKAVMALIVLLVAGVALAIWQLLPGWLEGRPAALQTSAGRTPEELLTAERAEILSRALTPVAQQLARGAMGEAASSAQRTTDVRNLAAQGDQPWIIEALGWIASHDSETGVRLAAVEELGKFDYAATRQPLLRLLEPSQRRPVIDRAGVLLARQRNLLAANNLLGQLTSRDTAAADIAAGALQKMTGLELASGPCDTSDGRQRYATLVKRWIDAGGPPPGQIWEPLPEPARIMEMADMGRGVGREMFEVRLVELAGKGDPAAWDRLVALAGLETSEIIRQRIVDALAKATAPPAYLVQVLLLGRVDDDHVAAILDNLSRSGAAGLPKPPARPTRLAGILWANRYRAWVAKAWPDLAVRYGEAAGLLPESELFELAAVLTTSPYGRDRADQVRLAAGETARGDFVAASLLVFFLRDSLSGDAQAEAEQALAGLGTQQAWFFLVDEHSSNERLTADTEKALRAGTLKDALAPVPTYGSDPLGRYLAWQFYMRFGLAHLDRLANRPFLVSRTVTRAELPVVVPKSPPESADAAAGYAQTLYGRLTPQLQSAERDRFPDYAAAGDEVTPRLVKLIEAGR